MGEGLFLITLLTFIACLSLALFRSVDIVAVRIMPTFQVVKFP